MLTRIVVDVRSDADSCRLCDGDAAPASTEAAGAGSTAGDAEAAGDVELAGAAELATESVLVAALAGGAGASQETA